MYDRELHDVPPSVLGLDATGLDRSAIRQLEYHARRHEDIDTIDLIFSARQGDPVAMRELAEVLRELERPAKRAG